MVEVFKTNIKSQKQANEIIRNLKHEFPDYKINFDPADCDKILRVESLNSSVQSPKIVQMIAKTGIAIEPLADNVYHQNSVADT